MYGFISNIEFVEKGDVQIMAFSFPKVAQCLYFIIEGSRIVANKGFSKCTISAAGKGTNKLFMTFNKSVGGRGKSAKLNSILYTFLYCLWHI